MKFERQSDKSIKESEIAIKNQITPVILELAGSQAFHSAANYKRQVSLMKYARERSVAESNRNQLDIFFDFSCFPELTNHADKLLDEKRNQSVQLTIQSV